MSVICVENATFHVLRWSPPEPYANVCLVTIVVSPALIAHAFSVTVEFALERGLHTQFERKMPLWTSV